MIFGMMYCFASSLLRQPQRTSRVLDGLWKNITFFDLKCLFCFDALSYVKYFFIILPVNVRACQSSKKRE